MVAVLCEQPVGFMGLKAYPGSSDGLSIQTKGEGEVKEFGVPHFHALSDRVRRVFARAGHQQAFFDLFPGNVPFPAKRISLQVLHDNIDHPGSSLEIFQRRLDRDFPSPVFNPILV